MKRHHSLLVGLMLVGAISARSLPSLGDPPIRGILLPAVLTPTQAKKAPVAKDFGCLPLSFESNQGQTDSKVRFLTHSGDSTLFLTPTEAVFSMAAQPQSLQQEKSALLKGRKNRNLPPKLSRVALRMQMVGSDPRATPLTQQPLAGQINYFIGKDPKKWHAGVPTFGRVGFHQVYPGVDLVYYGNQKNLEYDFMVAPHADPKRIKLAFAGAQTVQVNRQGDLIVGMNGTMLRWQKPAVYQAVNGGKHAVTGRFRLERTSDGQLRVGFALGRYDTRRALVIDPVLLQSTFLSGSGSDEGRGIAVDNAGSVYVTGQAGSTDFPVTPGAYQTTIGSAKYGSVFVTKLNSTGTALVYSTFLGGSNFSSEGDTAWAIALDSGGSVYITGTAGSSDFPVTLGAFQTTNKGSGSTAFVTKLNPTGTALIYSTFLGGSNGANAYGLAVDSGGNAYITGQTGSTDFPVTPGAFQTANQGKPVNAFVTKLNQNGTGLIYSTFLGGSNFDSASSITVDSSGNAYITGQTGYADFPITPGAFQTAIGINSTSAFVTKLNPTGTLLVYSTFLGSGSYGAGIAVDNGGDAYITGYAGSGFPTTPGAFQTMEMSVNSSAAFVTKLNPTGTGLVYSTLLGGSGYDGGRGIAVDSSGYAYVIGFTGSSDFPITPGAFQTTTRSARQDTAFVTKLNATGTALIYSSYLGGSGSELATSIAIDAGDNAYITGFTTSTDFPTTPGAYQTTKGSNENNAVFVTKVSPVPTISDFNNDGFTDLLLQNASTNAIISWFMHGSTFTGGAYFTLNPPSDYSLVGTGDFGLAGAGITTLVFQSSLTNKIIFWYTGGANNATITGGDYVNVTPAAGWKLVGIGDFNGDGKSDLVVQNQTTYQIAIYFMSGPYYQGGVLLPYHPPVGWKVVGVGDFNHDGFTDIAFQIQTTGQIALWYMNGTTYFNGLVMPTAPPAGWAVVAAGDYNGDGVSDLVFQSPTSNQGMVWFLSSTGGVRGSAQLSTRAPAGWNFVGPR